MRWTPSLASLSPLLSRFRNLTRTLLQKHLNSLSPIVELTTAIKVLVDRVIKVVFARYLPTFTHTLAPPRECPQKYYGHERLQAALKTLVDRYTASGAWRVHRWRLACFSLILGDTEVVEVAFGLQMDSGETEEAWERMAMPNIHGVDRVVGLFLCTKRLKGRKQPSF